jgi:hypothetical protein
MNWLIPASLPEPRLLPKCKTRYGIPNIEHRLSSSKSTMTDFSWRDLFGEERFGR